MIFRRNDLEKIVYFALNVRLYTREMGFRLITEGQDIIVLLQHSL